MASDLVEKIAVAIMPAAGCENRSWHGRDGLRACLPHARCHCREYARYVLAAIDASGTHRVAPVKPTEAMLHELEAHWYGEEGYAAMLAAAPKPGE